MTGIKDSLKFLLFIAACVIFAYFVGMFITVYTQGFAMLILQGFIKGWFVTWPVIASVYLYFAYVRKLVRRWRAA